MKLEIDEVLVELIQDATKKALSKLFQEHKEKFYYCSLITTGEGLCPIISAWSEEALERVAGEEDDKEEAKYYLKWSYAETPYFCYGEEYFEDVNKVFLDRLRNLKTENEKDKEIQLRINSMEKVMHNLDMMGMFGQGEQRLNIVINAEFMPPDFTNTERARNELEFSLFCMLEEDGCTVDVMVDNLAYTFTCSMARDIVSVSRADGEKFGINGAWQKLFFSNKKIKKLFNYCKMKHIDIYYKTNTNL